MSKALRPVGIATAAVTACALAPAPLHAHLVTTGLGPYYDGIGHLLLTPQDLLPLVAMALLAGLGGPAIARAILFSMPLAWLVGGVVGLTRPGEWSVPLLTTATVLVAGGLLAADRELPPRLTAAVGVTVGLVHGFLNGTAMSAAGYGFRAMLGIVCCAFVLIALGGALALASREGWTRIAVRVAGSWVFATGLLMLGWALR